jgi:hypothetical protein
MWRRVDPVWTDVSEQRTFSIFKVEKPRARNQREVTADWAIFLRWFLPRGFFYPEDGGDTFLRNVGSHKIYTAPHPRRRHSSKYK